MTWARVVVLILALGACASDSPIDPADLREEVLATMGAFAAMDFERFTGSLAEDVGSFEMDLEGAPVRLASRDEVARWTEGVFQGMKGMGASMSLDIHSADCRADSVLAYCTVEFDLVAEMADGSRVSQPTRNTIVLRKEQDGWKWAHWHSSAAQ